MIGKDTEVNLRSLIEKAEILVDEINQQIPDSGITDMINQKKGNYFIYEEMFKNLKFLENPDNLNRHDDFPDQTAKTIKEINDNFIAGNILEEIDKILQSSVKETPTSEIKVKLLEMISYFSTLIENEQEMNEEKFCRVISSTMEFIQILNKLRDDLKLKFTKKADI
jgi:hypothetical protein